MSQQTSIKTGQSAVKIGYTSISFERDFRFIHFCGVNEFDMKTQFLLFILCISALAGSAQRVTLSGTIRDSKTGEVLIGATVYAPDLKTGTITNA